MPGTRGDQRHVGECYARASMRRALIVVGKAPLAGSTKTRLVPPLSPQDAADLYHGFLIDTLEMAASLAWERTSLVHPRGDGMQLAQLAGKSRGAVVRAAWRGSRQRTSAPRSSTTSLRLRAGHPDRQRQSDTVLGASSRGLQASASGADLPIGPTFDGGYYLIGMRQPHLGVFDRHRLEHPSRLRPDARRARALGLRVHNGGRVVRRRRARRPGAPARKELSNGPPDHVAPHTRLVLERLGRLSPLAPAASASRPSAQRSARVIRSPAWPASPAAREHHHGAAEAAAGHARAVHGRVSLGDLHQQVDFRRRDLEVVAHRGVRRVEQSAQRAPRSSASSAGDRVPARARLR